MFVLGSFAFAGLTAAHTVRPAIVDVVLGTDGTFTVSVDTNVEQILAGIGGDVEDTDNSPNAALYDELRALPPDAIRARFEAMADEYARAIEARFDGVPAELSYDGIEVGPIGDVELARDSIVALSGRYPVDAQTFVWLYPERYGSSAVRIGYAGGADVQAFFLNPGQASDAVALGGDIAPRSRLSVAVDYVVLGFEHIVPKGLDHILFVLGIFLLSQKLGSLIWQVTAFTIAHTITLALSIYGIVSLSPSIVEPLIAASIVYVGVENILVRQLHSWRVALVFMFGLLHGLGFAGVLTEIGLPESEFVTALITFNIGVELGQLAVIAIAFALVGWFRKETWYRSAVVIPGSALIALIGLYWTIERVL